MGRTAQENFNRRFGNPPRITVRFVDIDSEPDRDYRYDKIFEAWVGCVRSLLGREPTEPEIFGTVSLEAVINDERSKGVYRDCLNNNAEIKSMDKIRPGSINRSTPTIMRSRGVGASPTPAIAKYEE